MSHKHNAQGPSPVHPDVEDIRTWNAFMLDGAKYDKHDIPRCPTTARHIPEHMITWREGKEMYNGAMRRGDASFFCNAFVCFYLDDYRFDGPKKGIWTCPESVEKTLRHFDGVVTPDFSTYQDFPEFLKGYNTLRMRQFGYWLGRLGHQVVNNVRWGTSETWDYCFNGIDRNSMVCVGTVGGNPKKLEDRARFNSGFYEMIKRLQPNCILVYGSSRYPCFEEARASGIRIVSYEGKTSKSFSRIQKARSSMTACSATTKILPGTSAPCTVSRMRSKDSPCERPARDIPVPTNGRYMS